jgi:electron transport complex protein RnfD
MLIILIRNLGVFVDGTVLAILILNLFHPLIDRIHRPVLGAE